MLKNKKSIGSPQRRGEESRRIRPENQGSHTIVHIGFLSQNHQWCHPMQHGPVFLLQDRVTLAQNRSVAAAMRMNNNDTGRSRMRLAHRSSSAPFVFPSILNDGISLFIAIRGLTETIR